MRVFVDGVSVIDYAHVINYAPATTTLIVGTTVDYRDTSANFKLNGHIDDVRLTKGVARYTTNFTPPTAAFPHGPIPGTPSTNAIIFDNITPV